MFKKFLIIVVFIYGTNLYAFHGAIEGKVSNYKGNHLIGAQVWLEGYEIGDVTDETGWYKIGVPTHGQFKVVYQYIGFKAETLSVTVPHGEQVRKDVILKKSVIPGKEIEVKGRREDIYKVKTPEPTTVIPYEAAERAGAKTLGEAVELEPGIELQSKCSMCAASEISIQGLPGRFSLILLDGMPVFSGLASKYILDMFPVDFMDNIKVLKGASGAIWGSNAVSGAVNILLPQPSEQLMAKGSYTHRNYGSDFSGMFSNSLKSVGITAMAARSDRGFVDLNGDNISENTAFLRDIYLTSLSISPVRRLDLNLGGSYADEVRKGGAIVPDSEYGTNPDAEKISTHRWDVWQHSGFKFSENELKFKLALSSHSEDGVVEMSDYWAHQKTLYGELSAKRGKFISGVSLSKQFLSDTRLFDSYDENDCGIWTSVDSRVFGANFLTAGRVDFNSNYGTIFSPYGAIKFLLGEIKLNFAAGTGFRTPSIIFESMECLPVGYQYAIRRDENLSKESSISVQGGVGKMIMFNNFMADFKLNFFYHRVSNFINARFEGIDSSTGRAIFYYYNLDELTTSTGTELSTAFALPKNIDLTLGAFVLSPKSANGQILPFINRWGLNYSATYKNDYFKFEFNTIGELNGPMVVETVYEDSSVRSSYSPVYTTLNLRGAKDLGHFKLTLGVNNLLDYRQPPLSQYGKTEYYWGPIIGREFYSTVSIRL